MKGLLKNNYLGMIESIKLVMIIILALGGISLVIGEATLVGLFPFVPAPVMAVLSIANLRKESMSKWCKQKIIFPVQRKDIVKSQYVSHIITLIVGTVLVSLFLVCAVVIHGNIYFFYGFRDAITLVLSGTVLSVFIGALAYPLYYLWGESRTEIIILLSVFGSVMFVLTLSAIINTVTGERTVNNMEYYIGVGLISCVAIIVYAISYFITVRINSKKEY